MLSARKACTLAAQNPKTQTKTSLRPGQDATALLIANRSGAVLGGHTILKEDHFPGCQSGKLALTVPGAPNFRGVPGARVFGSALPNLEGIRGVLQHTGCAPSTSGSQAAGKQVHFAHVQRSTEPPVGFSVSGSRKQHGLYHGLHGIYHCMDRSTATGHPPPVCLAQAVSVQGSGCPCAGRLPDLARHQRQTHGRSVPLAGRRLLQDHMQQTLFK